MRTHPRVCVQSAYRCAAFLLVVLCQPSAYSQGMIGHVDLVGSTREFDMRGEITNAQICVLNPDVISFESVESAQWRHLWWIDVKERKPHQISPRKTSDDMGAETDREMCWSPVRYDGKTWFVFVSSGDDNNDDLFIGNLSDDVYGRLTSHPASDHHPRWSPDGRQIAFVSARSGSGDIYLIRNVRELIGEISLAAAQLKPAGPEPRPPQVIDCTSQAILVRLTNNPDIDTYPDWSPDGRWIAYQAYVTGEGRRHCELFVIDPSNPESAPGRLTDNSTTEKLQPRWSSDGEGISYYSLPVTSDPTATDIVALEQIPLTQVSLCVPPMPARSGSFVVSGNVRRNENAGPSWCPGTTLLMFIKYAGRETPVMASDKGLQPGAPSAQEVKMPGGNSPVQYRSLDVHRFGKTARLALISYEKQDYNLYCGELRTEANVSGFKNVDVIVAGQERLGDHFGVGGEFMVVTPAPWQRVGVTRGGGSYYLDFSRIPGCILGFPVRYGGRWSVGVLQLPGARDMSTQTIYMEWQALLSTDVKILSATLTPFLSTGVDLVVAHDHGSEVVVENNILGWPFGGGVSFELARNIEGNVSLVYRSMTPGFLKKETQSGDPSANFLALHFGVTYRFPHSSGAPNE